LLKPLKQLGVKALGAEPSINVSKIANDNDLETMTAFFNEKAAGETVKKHGKPDVVITSRVFTHLENLHAFTQDVIKLLSDDGVFIIEVEYIGHILDTAQYERFYLDRIFYYSLTSLDKLLARSGLYIADCKKINVHGTSIQVHAKRIGR